jgi:hypothetical protein
MAGTVCIKAINQSGQHSYNTRVAFSACFLCFPNRSRPRSSFSSSTSLERRTSNEGENANIP